MDFQNDAETIEDSFANYYRTTLLSSETDPDRLHTLQTDLDHHQVYTPEQVEDLVRQYLDGADADKLHPILDACVGTYLTDLDEDKQVDFKGKAKAFVRTYDFLATILPYGVPAWEKLSIFPKPACAQAACPCGRGPFQRDHRSHRHGQLPRGEEGDDGHRIAR